MRLLLVELIRQRPSWLPEGKPWIERDRAEELAALPHASVAAVDAALAVVQRSVRTLENPAGLFVTTLRGLSPEAVAQHMGEVNAKPAKQEDTAVRVKRAAEAAGLRVVGQEANGEQAA